jgi:hypothetical protein
MWCLHKAHIPWQGEMSGWEGKSAKDEVDICGF